MTLYLCKSESKNKRLVVHTQKAVITTLTLYLCKSEGEKKRLLVHTQKAVIDHINAACTIYTRSVMI